jgi:hypothetical protein
VTSAEERIRAALTTVAGHLLARHHTDPTPAQETVLRRALAAEAERLRKTAAPGWTPEAAAEPTDCLESKAMETVPKEAQRLQPGDVITRHPDHPDRDVWYRVATWPRRITAASVLIDYTCRPEQVNGETAGVLMLDLDQPCEVVPAHAHGGAR